MSDRTDYNLHKRRKHVAAIFLPEGWAGAPDFLDIWRAGNKTSGYAYGITIFSDDGTFRHLWLTEEERVRLIEALGGTA